MKNDLFEIFAQRNPAPRRIAEKPERTRVPPRRAIAAKWAWSRRAIVTYHNRAHTRIYPTNTYTPHTHIYTCTPPVGSIVKERCGWQEWKAHARASGSSARATGPSARAREHARAALTRKHVHAHIGGCGLARVYVYTQHTRARARRTHICVPDTRARGHPPRTRARTSSGRAVLSVRRIQRSLSRARVRASILVRSNFFLMI